MNRYNKFIWLIMLILIVSSSTFVYAIGEIVGRYPYRYGNVGCTFDTTNNVFYVYHEALHRVYKLDGTSFALVDSIAVPFSIAHADYAWSMTYDGTYLWLACPWHAGNEGLYGMDPVTGDSVGYIDTGVGNTLRGVDWDGQNFWIGINQEPFPATTWIYKISPTGAHIDSFETSGIVNWLNQICFAEDQIWINNDRLWFSSFDLMGNHLMTMDSQIPGDWAQLSHDLTFDGNDIVTICWDQDKIYKMYIGKGHGEYFESVTNLSAYSDPSMPTSIRLNWTNPTQYLNGNTATVASVNIYDWETATLVANATGEEYTVIGLTNAESYNFYLQAVNNGGIEGAVSERVGTRAGGPLAGDLLYKLPLYTDGWTSTAWDGSHAWIYNENSGYWAKIDITTGDTLKTIPFAQWSNGCFWDDSDGTIWLNSPGTGVGEVWQIDTLGNLVSWFPTDLNPSGSCRGIAWDGNNIWIGQTDQSTFYLFDKFGIDQGTVYADTPIAWQRGMTWVGDTLWVLDGTDEILRFFEYNGTDSLHQVGSVSYWWEGWPLDLAYTGDKVIVAGWQADFLFFLHPGGAIVGIEDEQNELPYTFNLAQNYPNPFNPETHIVYTIPNAEKVHLEIYNTLGQKVTTLVNKKETAGKHEVIWNGLTRNGTLAASGVYFYKLVAGDFIKVRKMILLR